MNDDYQYTYDADGNVTSETNTQHTAFNENFTYDGLSQLTAVSRGTDSGYQSFTMNNIGDIQSVTADGTTTNRTTNADNQIINIGSATISYDNNGNVTTDDKGNTLVYDAWNRLVEVKNSSGDLVAGYTYDGLGRMTSETDGITTIDFYYSGQQIVEERTGVTNATGGSTGSNGSVTEELVYAPDYVNDVLSRDTYVSGSYSSRVYFTHDANYDVTGVVQNSTAGTMLQRMTYDAYGNVTFLTSSWATTTDAYAVENLWQGGWRDVNTGYYHFQERWYSPSMQWLSWDPANYPDGPSAYLPIADNPINRTDARGLDATTSTAPTTSPAPGTPPDGGMKWDPTDPNASPMYVVRELEWNHSVESKFQKYLHVPIGILFLYDISDIQFKYTFFANGYSMAGFPTTEDVKITASSHLIPGTPTLGSPMIHPLPSEAGQIPWAGYVEDQDTHNFLGCSGYVDLDQKITVTVPGGTKYTAEWKTHINNDGTWTGDTKARFFKD